MCCIFLYIWIHKAYEKECLKVAEWDADLHCESLRTHSASRNIKAKHNSMFLKKMLLLLQQFNLGICINCGYY